MAARRKTATIRRMSCSVKSRTVGDGIAQYLDELVEKRFRGHKAVGAFCQSIRSSAVIPCGVISSRTSRLAKAESGLAAILMRIGDDDRAEVLYRRLLQTRLDAYGPDDPDVANTQRSLGILLYLRGDFEGAEPFLRQALDVRVRAYGREHTASASVLSSLGRLLHDRGARARVC